MINICQNIDSRNLAIRNKGDVEILKKPTSDKFSAAEHGLGYIYQPRFALLKILQLPEEFSILIEMEDDIEFADEDGNKTLGSLKHKALGDRLTDLSVDFWKSVRIWLVRYEQDDRIESSHQFYLFTTSEVSSDSFLVNFLPTNQSSPHEKLELVELALSKTNSKTINPIKDEFEKLSEEEQKDFLSRIVIFDKSPRIDDVPTKIMNQHMRTIRSGFREYVFEQLEGWWNNEVLKLLTGQRTSEIFGHEVSDKLASIADQYKTDNLPINYRGKKPDSEADPENDQRIFVIQLREIGIGSNRIQNAIYDYYRAFEQRSSWVRENVLVNLEMEDFEDRLTEEWGRYRDVVFECIDEKSSENTMRELGKELYKWAEFNTNHIKIRERVSEPYVVRGNFHILANHRPTPRVYWHPRFLEKLEDILQGGKIEKVG